MNIHFKKHFFIFLFFGLVILAGLSWLGKKSQFEPLFLFSELQTAFFSWKKGTENLVKKYSWLLSLRKENQKLKEQNRHLKARQQLFDETLTENERLKKLLQFPLSRRFDFLPAQVSGTDFLSKNELLTINKGSRHGVKKFMGVIHPSGIVGYIFRVNPRSAQVLSLLNPLSSLPARVQTSRITGLISAHKKNLLRFDYMDQDFSHNQKIRKLKEGTAIVTMKSSQFPAGFLVGHIASVKFSSKHLEPEIYIKPAVPFHSLEEVLVLAGGQALFPELKPQLKDESQQAK